MTSTQTDSIEFKYADGRPTSLKDFHGKVALLVNVASKCGLTPQYEGLESLYKKYRDQGFTVLGFPANEFGGQEPGSDSEIQEFCRGTFGVEFPVFAKIVVKGEGIHPLYKYLTTSHPKGVSDPNSRLEKALSDRGLLSGGASDIKWNFEKFLIGRDGKIIERFSPDITPEDPRLIRAVETALSASGPN